MINLTSLFIFFTETETPTPDVVTNELELIDLVKYGVLLGIIFVCIILIAITKKVIKTEASTKKTLAKIDKAINYVEKIKNKTSKQELLIASPKLVKLTSLISGATWNATRTAEEKKDVILDNVASSLDILATYIGKYSEETFYNQDEYIEKLEYVHNSLIEIKNKLTKFIQEINS